MHMPGPSQDVLLAYLTIVWAAAELPLYAYCCCMSSLDVILACQYGLGDIVWQVTFEILGEKIHTCAVHSSLQE